MLIGSIPTGPKYERSKIFLCVYLSAHKKHNHLTVWNFVSISGSFASIRISQEEEKFLKSNKLVVMFSGILKFSFSVENLIFSLISAPESFVSLEKSWSWQDSWAPNVNFISGTWASLNICILNKFSCNSSCRGKRKTIPSLTAPSSAS